MTHYTVVHTEVYITDTGLILCAIFPSHIYSAITPSELATFF